MECPACADTGARTPIGASGIDDGVGDEYDDDDYVEERRCEHGADEEEQGWKQRICIHQVLQQGRGKNNHETASSD